MYFEGKPLQARGRKSVYKSIGAAKCVITEEAKTLAYEVMRKKFGSDYYSHPEELEEEIEKQKQKFEVKNYLPLGVRQEVAWFGTEMEKQLAANDHKGGWKNEPDEFFLDQIQLRAYDIHVKSRFTGITREEKIQLAADIANFAMMLADNAKGEK